MKSLLFLASCSAIVSTVVYAADPQDTINAMKQNAALFVQIGEACQEASDGKISQEVAAEKVNALIDKMLELHQHLVQLSEKSQQDGSIEEVGKKVEEFMLSPEGQVMQQMVLKSVEQMVTVGQKAEGPLLKAIQRMQSTLG